MGEQDEIFGRWIESANDWLSEFMAEASLTTKKSGLLGLRAGLHALRDRLTVDELAQLAAQLPILLRGAYYEGWIPANNPVKFRRPEELYDRIRKELGPNSNIDPKRVVWALFRLLSHRVSRGEINDIMSALPNELACVWEQSEASSLPS